MYILGPLLHLYRKIYPAAAKKVTLSFIGQLLCQISGVRLWHVICDLLRLALQYLLFSLSDRIETVT